MIRKKLIYLGLISAIVMTATACNKATQTNNQNGLVTESKQTSESRESSEENSIEVDESLFKKLVVEVGSEKVYYSEAMIYFKYIQAQYEDYFGDQIWNYDFNGQTFGIMAKNEIVDMIAQTKIINAQADKYKVTLTDEDELQIQQNSKDFLAKLTEEDKLRYGLTQEVAEKFYHDNKLYESVYDAATMDVNTDVSEEEAKQITVEHLLILTTQTDGDGKSIPFSEDKKKEAYKKAKKLLKQAKKAEDFKTYAGANTDDTQVEFVFGKGEMSIAYENVALALKTGELSGIVETDKGYYIIYCVSDYNEDATLEKKEEIIEERQDKYFQEIYENWSKKYKVEVNSKVWDTMNFEVKTPEGQNTAEQTADLQTTETTKTPTQKPTAPPTGE